MYVKIIWKQNFTTINCYGTGSSKSSSWSLTDNKINKKKLKVFTLIACFEKYKMIRCTSLSLLLLAIFVFLSTQTTSKPLVSLARFGPNNRSAAVQKNSYSQSIKHFLKDLKNMAGGFVTNRMDKLQHKQHQAKEKIKNMFRKLVASFQKKS